MTYRLYIVSGFSGRFEPALEFDAPNDNALIGGWIRRFLAS